MKEIEYEPKVDDLVKDEIISELVSKLPAGTVVNNWKIVVKASLKDEVEAKKNKKERVVRYVACF